MTCDKATLAMFFYSQPQFLNDNDRRAFEALQGLEASYRMMLFELVGCVLVVAVLCYAWFRIRFGRKPAAATKEI